MSNIFSLPLRFGPARSQGWARRLSHLIRLHCFGGDRDRRRRLDGSKPVESLSREGQRILGGDCQLHNVLREIGKRRARVFAKSGELSEIAGMRAMAAETRAARCLSKSRQSTTATLLWRHRFSTHRRQMCSKYYARMAMPSASPATKPSRAARA